MKDLLKKGMTSLASLALLATGVTMLPAASSAEEIKIAVGCPPVPFCSDWVYAEDLAASLRESGMKAKVFTGGALGKDPELVNQLSQNLLQFGLTNFVMIKEADPRITGFIAPHMFDDMEHFFRATQETDSELLNGIKASMEKQGIKIAGLPGLGGTMGIFNTSRPISSAEDARGLRLRAIDSSQNDYFATAGIKGVVIDMPEFASAVQQGVVDGYMNPPIVPMIFKHTEFLKHYTDIGAGTPFRSALMSADWYDGLDDDARTKVDAAIKIANDKNRAWTLAAIPQEIAGLKKAGVTVTELSDDELENFRKISREAWKVLVPADTLPQLLDLAESTRK